MKRTIAATCGCLLLIAAPVVAQESAKVEVTVKIEAKTPSFKGQRLVVMLYHDHPRQPDRGNTGVASHVNKSFSHTQGSPSLFTITLGEDAKVDPAVQYTVNVTVFDVASNRTHHGELQGRSGPFGVLTNGAPNRLTLTLVPEPAR